MGKRRTRRKRLPEPCPSIEVEGLVHDGRCIAHRDGKAVFIDGALPGEAVAFEYLATHRKFDEGRVTGIQRASPDRVEPFCPHFGTCGGCSLQHMAPAAQIRAKQELLLDNFRHIGRVEPGRLLPPLTGPDRGYRTKARLGVKYVHGKERTLVGFREKRRSLLAELHGCAVLHPAIGNRIEALAQLIDTLEARERLPQIEVAVTESVAALVFRHLDPLSAPDRVRLQAFGEQYGLHIYLQPAGPDSVHLLWPEASRLEYELPDQAVRIGFRPTDFTQINPVINRQIVGRVLELLDVTAQSRVLDLFCGLGNFTLPLARSAGHVTGVEGEAGLVERARANARRNGLGNTEFHVADLATDNTAAAWAGAPYDRVLLDPPRSGADAVMNLLGNIRPQRIVYVSCHPGSLARDAGRLVSEYGYRMPCAGVMDMFPHTAHVESIALFERG